MTKLLLSFLLLSTHVMAQQEDSLFIRSIADEILVSGKAYENLRVLCKTVGGRLAGSPQTAKAESWGMNTLQQAGADRVYLQECTVPHWERGGKDVAWIQYTDEKGKSVTANLDVLALGNSLGTGKQGVKAPVILINNFDELEKRKDEVKGKIVFYNYPFNPRYVVTMRAYGESGLYRRSGPSRAAKYGAVAVMIRSMSESTDNNPHTGSTSYDSAYPKIPCAAMGLRDADKLSQLLQGNKTITGYLKTGGHFLPDTIAHNVIGEWRGTEKPDEIITVGGHLDSWDPAEGAHDDGAGCVHSIEVLRVLKQLGYKPRHTIRVVLFANEENGARGGMKYAEEAKQKAEKHLFALESDDGGFTPRGFGVTIAPDKLQKMRGWLPLLIPYGVYEFSAGGGGTDIGPLGRTLQTPLAGLSPDTQRYFDVHHARNDVFENVNKRELELGAVNITALIYLVDKYGL
ncbi:MAG: M20/M25/M40 family metallo-hydrolase [Williamsia sp.]|nr:M20/M25/M40 family metallo-hydrolase [Williamsia sp.]